MTPNSLVSIAACAQRIIDTVGPCDLTTLPLSLSERSPNLRVVNLSDLLDHTQLEEGAFRRVSRLVEDSLSHSRQDIRKRYRQVASELHSPRHTGYVDYDVESDLVKTFEQSYERHVEKLQALISNSIIRQCRPHANSRGGFGDVSHPRHITQS
jgi:hypothetical protein